jgi:hypothetical protein
VCRQRRPRARAASATLALLVLTLASVLGGCPCVKTITDWSPALRWWLFATYGAGRICPEMLKQGISLRLEDRSPAIGRFFPAQCAYNVNDEAKTVTVHVGGTGYGYMAPAKRVGFALSVSVEYRADFMIAGDDMYVWGRPNRIVQGPDFKLGYLENPLADLAANIPPFGGIANFLGNQVVRTEMNRGFTVIANEDKGNDFSLGMLQPPAKPHHPFDISASERFTFANETVDVYANQRDYLGPFEVAKAGQALYLTMSVQGPAVDVMVVDRRTGDAWREAYQLGRPLGPPPGPVLGGQPLQPGPQVQQRYVLAPGSYYVVVDNTAAAGAVRPPAGLPLLSLTDPLSRVSYLAQVGE